MKNLDDIKNLIKNKRVAIVGNSQRVLGKKYPVDEHDVVIRMNRAWAMPDEMKQDIGSRIDILCVSIEQDHIEKLSREYDHVIWMTPKHREEFSESLKDRLYFYPENWRDELLPIIGASPSTGCMTFDMVRRFIDKGHVTLYGFDFFQSGNWYQKKKLHRILKDFFRIPHKATPHSGSTEEQFIKNSLPEEQLLVEEL